MPLRIAGLLKTSAVDYPKNICSTIFTAGCNFRCPYCHNPELVNVPEDLETVSEQEVLEHLENRKDILDGLCITGGEPLIFDLRKFLQKVKDLELKVKLDTNGTNPERLKELNDAELVDYIAMDIKAPLEKYSEAVNTKVDTDKIKKSIGIIRNSGLDYEFRTTVVPSFTDESDLIEIGKLLEGSKKYAIQQFKPTKAVDEKVLKIEPYTKEKLKEFKKKLEKYFEEVELRV
ncbi:MAG: anaerobic ribonucleoside-triphosphate reductase activating protein [Candidatus Undinarchaeales archaeon]